MISRDALRQLQAHNDYPSISILAPTHRTAPANKKDRIVVKNLVAQGLKRLGTGGTVIGIFPDAEFAQESIQVQKGDVFLAYTDGITECVNEYGEEFGEQRLIELVGHKRDLSAEQLQKAIVDEVLSWAFEEERDDDMTMIVARFL